MNIELFKNHPPYTSPLEKIWHFLFWGICLGVLLFLIFPILVIIPLSFNVEPYFSFTPGMLALDPAAFSLKWYQRFLQDARWMNSIGNSIFVAIATTILSVILGTLAALGLSQNKMPARNFVMGLLISPMIVPIIITAAGIYAFYARIGLTNSLLGIVLAHTVLGTPFVVITVTATLINFDRSLIRAGQMLGASPLRVFFKVVLPLILPGVISGALFAFATSFDEIATVLFIAPGPEYYTIPREMFAGIREQISPVILAVASMLILISTIFLIVIEVLRRRS